MPRDVSWKQEIALAVGQEILNKDIDHVKVRGIYAGIAAPDFEATTLSGEPFKLAELRGRIVLLDFWATWCAPCVAELPNIKELHDQYSKEGLVVVSVSFDRTADAARDFVAANHLDWTQIYADKADKSPLADLYGVSAIPVMYLIGPDGTVVGRDLRGDQLREAIREQVEKLRKSTAATAEKPPAQNTTPRGRAVAAVRLAGRPSRSLDPLAPGNTRWDENHFSSPLPRESVPARVPLAL